MEKHEAKRAGRVRLRSTADLLAALRRAPTVGQEFALLRKLRGRGVNVERPPRARR